MIAHIAAPRRTWRQTCSSQTCLEVASLQFGAFTAAFLIILITIHLPQAKVYHPPRRLFTIKITSAVLFPIFSLALLASCAASRIKIYILSKKFLNRWQGELSREEQRQFRPLIRVLMENRKEWCHSYPRYNVFDTIKIFPYRLYNVVWKINTTDQPNLRAGAESLTNWLIAEELINVDATIKSYAIGPEINGRSEILIHYDSGINLDGMAYMLSYDRMANCDFVRDNGARLNEMVGYVRRSGSRIAQAITLLLENHAPLNGLTFDRIIFRYAFDEPIGNNPTAEQWQQSITRAMQGYNEHHYRNEELVGTDTILSQFLIRSPTLYYQQIPLLFEGITRYQQSAPAVCLTALAKRIQNGYDRAGELYREEMSTSLTSLSTDSSGLFSANGALTLLIFEYVIQRARVETKDIYQEEVGTLLTLFSKESGNLFLQGCVLSSLIFEYEDRYQV